MKINEGNINNRQSYDEDIPEDFKDPIHLDIMKDPVSLPCGHIFDSISIKTWLQTDESCPLCRNRNIKLSEASVLKQRITDYFMKKIVMGSKTLSLSTVESIQSSSSQPSSSTFSSPFQSSSNSSTISHFQNILNTDLNNEQSSRYYQCKLSDTRILTLIETLEKMLTSINLYETLAAYNDINSSEYNYSNSKLECSKNVMNILKNRGLTIGDLITIMDKEDRFNSCKSSIKEFQTVFHKGTSQSQQSSTIISQNLTVISNSNQNSTSDFYNCKLSDPRLSSLINTISRMMGQMERYKYLAASFNIPYYEYSYEDNYMKASKLVFHILANTGQTIQDLLEKMKDSNFNDARNKIHEFKSSFENFKDH